MPTAPLGLNRVRRVILGFFLGLFGGVALAFFCEFLDNTIKTNEDVDKHLGVPVLATVTQDEYKSCL
jgi:capsular polysaccharide biosynthesis protein